MKKLLLILLIGLLFSCNHRYITIPIEKYSGKEYIIWDVEECKSYDYINHVKLKNHEDIIKVYILKFDLELYNYKIGDTIK